MKPENKDYFTLAQDIVAAMETGDYVLDIAPDSPASDKTAFILESQALPNEDSRIQYPGALISTLILRQLTDNEHWRVPEEFEFAMTRYKGKGAFYFRKPDGREFDFKKLKDEIEGVKQMFAPKPLTVLPEPDIAKLKTEADEWVCMGPFSRNDAGFFQAIAGTMGNFHHVEIDMPIVSTRHGLYYAMQKQAYEGLLRNADMINKSGLYAGHLLDGEAKLVV